MRRMAAKPSAQSKPVVHKTRGAPRRPLAKSSGAKPEELPSPPPWRNIETEIPGVYLNRHGYRVDAQGIFIPLRRLQEMDQTRAEEVIGEPVTSPAQYLKRVALDPTVPTHQRIAAAVSAAPYFDRKMPQALEGSNPNDPIKVTTSVTLKNLNALSPEERKAALALLEKLGLLGG